MAINKGLMTSASDRWWTPPDLEAEIRAFLVWYFDPCPAREQDDPNPFVSGLLFPWDGLPVYLNPPYGRAIGAWTAKALRDPVREIIMLLPARTEAEWFQPLFNHTLCFIRGRLRFSGSEVNAPFPSALAYRGPRVEEFAKAFQHRGVIVQRYQAS